MVLLRLPTEVELDKAGVEAHTFLDAFNKNAESPFISKVKKKGHCVVLDEWDVINADWFNVVEGEQLASRHIPILRNARHSFKPTPQSGVGLLGTGKSHSFVKSH